MAKIEIKIDGDLLDDLSEAFAEAESTIDEPLESVSHQLIDRVDGLYVRIWADEHPPPHFHVTYQGEDASFSILDCRRLANTRDLERYESRIRRWRLCRWANLGPDS
jgi:hypothetical protein